jgi:hypothetical protein
MVGMEGELILPECIIVLKNMSNRKSPCLDGFTSKFYKFFWIPSFGKHVLNPCFGDTESKLFSSAKFKDLITYSWISIQKNL